MFSSVLDTSAAALSFESVLLCAGAALVLGVVIALVYKFGADNASKGFMVTLGILPMLVLTVIMMTSGNLGAGVAVMGAFSLVRFRSVPGTAKEILFIFFAMAIGLACGMGELLFAVFMTGVVSAVFLLMMKTGFAAGDGHTRHLKIRIPEDVDYTEAFEDVFAAYTRSAQRLRIKTVNLGSMLDLEYRIVLKDPKEEKRFLDDLRIRNGNLRIVLDGAEGGEALS
jgi:uncharacterized membrane protein YhiD involved in acid resistance